jgi:hypothetical protein
MGSVPAPAGDEQAITRLLAVQDELCDVVGEVAPTCERFVHAAMIMLDRALGKLGYEFPEPDYSCGRAARLIHADPVSR